MSRETVRVSISPIIELLAAVHAVHRGSTAGNRQSRDPRAASRISAPSAAPIVDPLG